MKMIMTLTVILAATQFGFPQGTDSTKKTPPPVTITDSVDGYYRFNFNNPKSMENRAIKAQYAESFTRQNFDI